MRVQQLDAQTRRAAPKAAQFRRGSVALAQMLSVAHVCALLAWWVALKGGSLSVWMAGAFSAFAGTFTWRVASRWKGHWHIGDEAASSRWLPQAVSVGPEQARHHTYWGDLGIRRFLEAFVVSTLALMAVSAAVGVFEPSNSSKGAEFLWLSAASALLCAIGFLVEDHIQLRLARRFVRAFSTASRAQGWTIAEGELSGRLERVTAMVTRGSGTQHVTESVTAPEQIRIGTTTIATEGVEWAADGWTSELKTDPSRLCEVYRYSAGEGSRAIALYAGEERGEAPWSVTGPGSLLLFTSPGDPRRALRRALLVQHLGPAPLLLSLLAAYLAS